MPTNTPQPHPLEQRLRLAHQARRAKEHQLDDIRRALCDIGAIEDDDPYSHADLADVIRQNGQTLIEEPRPTTAEESGLNVRDKDQELRAANEWIERLNAELDEARQWARHGYEIGQKHCGWSDHGVAPAWLTEGWPRHIESCEHLKQMAELDMALTRVRALATRLEEFSENALKDEDRQLYATLASDLRTRIDGSTPGGDA